MSDERTAPRGMHPGEAHFAGGEIQHLQCAGVVDQPLEVLGHELLGTDEHIDGTDVFAAITNSEEANILSAMLAKRLGATRVMALVNRPSYADLIESGSIDVAIAPQNITIGSLLAHVRRGDVVRVHSLRHGAAEAIEAVARGEEVIMAHHDARVQANDHLILFLADRRHIDAVERLFTRVAP